MVFLRFGLFNHCYYSNETSNDTNPRNVSFILYFALENYKEGSERQNSLEYDEENNMVYGFENNKKAFWDNFRKRRFNNID